MAGPRGRATASSFPTTPGRPSVKLGSGTPRLPRVANRKKRGAAQKRPGGNPCSASTSRARSAPAPSGRQRRDQRAHAASTAPAPGTPGPRLSRGRGNAQNLSLHPGSAGRPKRASGRRQREGLVGATPPTPKWQRDPRAGGGRNFRVVEGRFEWAGIVPQSAGPASATAPLRGTPGCRREPVGSKLYFPSSLTGCGPRPLELSTGGRPVPIQENLLVVGAIVAVAALCVCVTGFKYMIPVFSS